MTTFRAALRIAILAAAVILAPLASLAAGSTPQAGPAVAPPVTPAERAALTNIGVAATVWTMGHSFPKTAVPPGKGLICREGTAASVVQIDQRTDWPDGSLRFGVLSGSRAAAAGTCALHIAEPQAAAALTPVAGPAVTVELDLFEMQRSRIELGRFTGSNTANNTGFAVGDLVTVTLDGDVFSHTVTAKEAGLTERNFTALSSALMEAIEAHSNWVAGKFVGSTYNRFVVQRPDGDTRPFAVSVTTTGAAPVKTETMTPARERVRWTATGGKPLGPWLSGPVALELWTEAPFKNAAGAEHPHLTARLGARQYGSGPLSRHQVVVENAKTWAADPRNYTYDVRVRVGQTEVLNQTARVHLHHGRWSRSFGDPGLPARDWQYLRASRAVLNYAEGVSETVIKNMETVLAAADNSVTGNSIVQRAMPMAGGRYDIGPLPTWGAALIASNGDPRTLAITLAAANGGAVAPIHYRDERTGLPVSADRHPTTTFKEGAASGVDVLPALDPLLSANLWNPDINHQPSMHYLPYLLTGDRFYLEELQFWTNWSLMSEHPSKAYRDGAKLLLIGNETRGFAWAMRNLAHAVTVTPAADPFHAYALSKWRSNIDGLYERWWSTPKAPIGTPAEGIFPRYLNEKGSTGPWQEDMNIYVFGLAAEQELPRAREVLERGAKFAAARFNREAEGWCRVQGGGIYYAKLHDQKTWAPHATWGALAEANKTKMAGWPACATVLPQVPNGSYPVMARASLTVMADAGIADAIAGLAWHRQAATTAGKDRVEATWQQDPTFAVVPR